MRYLFICALLCFLCLSTSAQSVNRCASFTRLKAKMDSSPAFRAAFEAERETFRKKVKSVAGDVNKMESLDDQVINIPVVFHIVLEQPTTITNQQIFDQIDTLNKTYNALNFQGNLPPAFKGLASGLKIQFCLAQQQPDGLPSSGIDRKTTTVISFNANDDFVKTNSTGGVDAWNPNLFLNVWICNLQDGVLGYGTFPESDEPSHQGVVIDAQTLPKMRPFRRFSQGKTLVHEVGHFFNLYHIWGDDDGKCTGTDDIDDTPNQADATYGFPKTIVTDACSPNAPGIMFQNYMDYSDDSTLLLFTNNQVTRMETAISAYRQSLTESPMCQPASLKTHDLELISLLNYEERFCSPQYIPQISIRNRGTSKINEALISYRVGSSNWETFVFTGPLNSLQTTTISLPVLQLPVGKGQVQFAVNKVDGAPDEVRYNDSLKANYQYYPALAELLQESFEGDEFPPPGWDIQNPDAAIGWKKYTGIAFTGNTSVGIDNFDYAAYAERDYIRMPQLDLRNRDSAFLSFQLAAATFSDHNGTNPVWDTLEVLVSRDCGKTYTSLYKKWGGQLTTIKDSLKSEFIPVSRAQWRKDSVNLTNYINQGEILIAFRNTTGFENNVYLDDINIRLVSVLPVLRDKGVLVSPNPTTGIVNLQFYPTPSDLTSIQLFDSRGSLLQKKDVNFSTAGNFYQFNLSTYSSGVYYLRTIRDGKINTYKIIKL